MIAPNCISWIHATHTLNEDAQSSQFMRQTPIRDDGAESSDVAFVPNIPLHMRSCSPTRLSGYPDTPSLPTFYSWKGPGACWRSGLRTVCRQSHCDPIWPSPLPVTSLVPARQLPSRHGSSRFHLNSSMPGASACVPCVVATSDPSGQRGGFFWVSRITNALCDSWVALHPRTVAVRISQRGRVPTFEDVSIYRLVVKCLTRELGEGFLGRSGLRLATRRPMLEALSVATCLAVPVNDGALNTDRPAKCRSGPHSDSGR
ncbi:hypothetical protein J2T11_003233 [Paenarthrobacter nicotinovorans]|nr:hypothetical protein [Paenarthrobacter nicotinovorans]